MDGLISLFTDAGLMPDGFGAWAAWAKRDGETIRRSAVIKRLCVSSTEAELCAIANGLAFVCLKWNPPEQTTILLQTDSTGAISAIKGQVNQFPDIVSYVNDLIANRRLILALRHVKGHRGTVSPRHAVNTWCDRECTKLLRDHRIINKNDPKQQVSFTHRGAILRVVN